MNFFSLHSYLIFFSRVAQFAGEDPVVALEAALQFEDTRESMQAFCVGQYMEVKSVMSAFIYLDWCRICDRLDSSFLHPARSGDGDYAGPEQPVVPSDRHREEPRLTAGASCFLPGPEHASVTHGNRMCQ